MDIIKQVLNKAFDLAEEGKPEIAIDLLNGIPRGQIDINKLVDAYAYVQQYLFHEN